MSEINDKECFSYQDRLGELVEAGEIERAEVDLMLLGVERFRRFCDGDPNFYFEVSAPQAYGESASGAEAIS